MEKRHIPQKQLLARQKALKGLEEMVNEGRDADDDIVELQAKPGRSSVASGPPSLQKKKDGFSLCCCCTCDPSWLWTVLFSFHISVCLCVSMCLCGCVLFQIFGVCVSKKKNQKLIKKKKQQL